MLNEVLRLMQVKRTVFIFLIYLTCDDKNVIHREKYVVNTLEKVS